MTMLKKIIKLFFISLLTTFFAINANAQSEIPALIKNTPYQSYKELHRSFFETRNEKKDSQDNEKLWREAVNKKPDDLLLRAYWASSLTLIGRDSWMPWNKIKYAEEGIKVFQEIDNKLSDKKITKKLGETMGFHTFSLFDIWFVEAQTLLSLPDGIFKTHSQGKAILQSIINHPNFPKAAPEFQASVKEYIEEVNNENAEK
jgi:hypothetical protein